ncbi:DUF4263 domain-containing protein [Chryseobacterium nematophagum]|uniref:DUF4263 domain-containing protein n=1 Tax=Chryseobacterium nematophagum TaxID=2305228 RepID=A0A3M7LBQ7_9FLAO|nr:Shedu immune nuclease family protein [Chryseobacterium nematophagum]RMZ59967.1 DUF4263 domain-containing protein [Chryseobacterium nematophagum]
MIDKTEIEYFNDRDSKYYYISKTFKHSADSPSKRFIYKVFNHSEETKIEMQAFGEYVLRSSESNRDQVRILVFQDDKNVQEVILQKFINNKPQPLSFSFRGNELNNFFDFIRKIKTLDLSNEERHRLDESSIDSKSVIISKEEYSFLEAFRLIKGEDRIGLLEKLSDEELTKEDLDILSGRKKGLEEFRINLYEESSWDEKDWQKFFNANTWIFGYGLDYKFLEILQQETSVSNSDLDGGNTVFADFLLGTNKFTVLVELKRPDTPLFTSKDRSESWKLSKELSYAVSQILAQKAEWEIKGKQIQYSGSGEPIQQKTYDPKTILIIGNSDQYKGQNKSDIIKAKTFELFRRNSRNIDIITFTELFERAYFIVNQRTIEL